MQRGLAALGAELLHLETIGVITPILLGDVVAVFAVLARQSDLGANVAGLTHQSSSSREPCTVSVRRRQVPTPSFQPRVAEAGLEPATQRL